jgi:hypothetical protein
MLHILKLSSIAVLGLAILTIPSTSNAQQSLSAKSTKTQIGFNAITNFGVFCLGTSPVKPQGGFPGYSPLSAIPVMTGSGPTTSVSIPVKYRPLIWPQGTLPQVLDVSFSYSITGKDLDTYQSIIAPYPLKEILAPVEVSINGTLGYPVDMSYSGIQSDGSHTWVCVGSGTIVKVPSDLTGWDTVEVPARTYKNKYTLTDSNSLPGQTFNPFLADLPLLITVILTKPGYMQYTLKLGTP